MVVGVLNMLVGISGYRLFGATGLYLRLAEWTEALGFSQMQGVFLADGIFF